MGETMMCRYGALLALRLVTAVSAIVLSHSAFAAELPQVKISDANKVPECATPGRLSVFLEQRNGALDNKFQNIAADYMRIGEELDIRWDIAFFQMLLETGNLRFTGDVSSDQNNFAGLGATGRKNPGESFPDVETGVRAHLQHLLMYAGETVEAPVAERTRKVQEWGVLTSWQKTIKGPMTYSALAKKWAPGSRGYARDIENVADAFYSGVCQKEDPKPEMMALARPQSNMASATAAKKALAEVASAEDAKNPTPKVSGAELARRAVAEARASGSFVRSSLGASSIAETAAETADTAPAVTEERKPAPFKIINAEVPPEAEESPASAAAVAAAEAEAEAEATAAAKRAAPAKEKVLTAALGNSANAIGAGAAAKSSKAKPGEAAAAAGKCRVWTASYGGAHAIIIKAAADDMVNYTVLDVNEATAKREAEAYIAAYAKGGKTVGEYPDQTQALDKAFELCPEG